MLKNCIFRWRNEKGPYSFCFKMCSIDIKFKKNILQYWSPLSLLKNAFCCQSGFRTNGSCRLKTFGKSISPSQTKNYTSFYLLHKILFCCWILHFTLQSLWPDWTIYWTLGNLIKPLATINLPKSPTFLGNWNHFWVTFIDIWRFYSGQIAPFSFSLL